MGSTYFRPTCAFKGHAAFLTLRRKYGTRPERGVGLNIVGNGLRALTAERLGFPIAIRRVAHSRPRWSRRDAVPDTPHDTLQQNMGDAPSSYERCGAARPAWPMAIPMLMKALRRLRAAGPFCFVRPEERGLVEAVLTVRIHLPPAESQVRTCLSRELAFLGREAAVFRGCPGRDERPGSAETRGRGNIWPNGGDISVGTYSSTAPPVMRSATMPRILSRVREPP